MFGRKEQAESATSHEIGLLGPDSHFEGLVRFAGTLRLDGRIDGDITSEQGSGSVLVVNQTAVVRGNIVSDVVLISGRVEGRVTAHQRVEIFNHGILRGDIHTADIMIEGGAEFEGRCHMTQEDGAEAAAPDKTSTGTGVMNPGNVENERAKDLPAEPA